MKNYLYEVIIGGNVKVVDSPAVAEGHDGEGNISTQAVAEVSHLEYQDRVDIKNVVATDVQSAMSKVTLGEGQFYNSVTRLSEIHG